MVPSPCIRICKVDSEGICVGCYRSAEEIGQWYRASDDEKLNILKATDKRKPLLTKVRQWFTK